jgi:hypothetical protein
MNCGNAVLIGAQKAGTTSIYDWLSQHPDILAPEWAKDNYAIFTNPDLSVRVEEAYRRILSERTTQTLVLTSNVNYLFHADAAERIRGFDPRSKVICIIRNPVDRAFSAYQYARERDLERRTFDDAINDELSLGEGCYPTLWEKAQKSYIRHGMYHQQMIPYFERFPACQIFVGLYEDLRSDKERLMNELLSFLEVDTAVAMDLMPRNVTRGGSRSTLLNKLLYSSSWRQNALLGRLKKAVPYKVRYRLKKALIVFNAKQAGKREGMRPETRARLLSVFEEDILKLQDLIKMDLGPWREPKST